MPTIDPKISVVVNLIVAIAGAVLAYVASNGLPAPIPAETSHLWQVWAQWIGGLGVAVVAAFNGYLHAVSSDNSGPLAK
jgi:hypothetical protein